eukprot:CAMPEP_0173424158 /NCGR_PEP_ID=MMETSP1357-20121228/4144_1 /TAXON_ID=77926 /ORGANISM="Hemiselmis rufescens, Strain PCC563" /LENGTH=335 /DNA_ID=CAMNT_0014387333 /DNA_START=146 /DNA_END=1149 /DNA_ORIENTATION=+
MGAMDRLFFRPNPLFTDQEQGKDGDFIRFSDSADSVPSGEPADDPWTRVEQKPVPPGTTKGRYQATFRIRPPTYVRSEDPNHPDMRIPVDPRYAHTVNLLPENSLWKDHDSEQDEGHPNADVLTALDQNTTEESEAFWKVLEDQKFDVRRWNDDDEYAKRVEEYGLQDMEKVSHLIPKLWFEPLSSEEEREARVEAALLQPCDDDVIPHTGHPFCVKCQMMLGVERPSLGLAADPGDPRCRFCGFLNAHDGDGRVLNDPEVEAVELEPSPMMRGVRQHETEAWMRPYDPEEDGDENPQDTVQRRRQTEQRCDECGHNRAYYHTRQVRSIDEGATA